MYFLIRYYRRRQSIFASKMQRKLGLLNLCHVYDAKNYVNDIIGLRPNIRYTRPTGIFMVDLIRNNNASHGDWNSKYGQIGSFTGLRIESMVERQLIYHIIGWKSC